MGPEPIWGSTSNVPFLGRCRAPGELSQFLKWVAFITVMNALQHNDMGADAVLANDNGFRTTPSWYHERPALERRDLPCGDSPPEAWWPSRVGPRLEIRDGLTTGHPRLLRAN